jgi:PHS family inorganic phosphate transporter-like MFS transporter
MPFTAFPTLLEGIGCGGVYPLAATLSAESCGRKEDRAKNIALTFSMQGVGYLVVPIIGWALISIFGEHSDYAWRILLGIGALPGLIVAILRRGIRRKSKSDDNDSFESLAQLIPPDSFTSSPVISSEDDSMIAAIRSEPELYRKLIGTAGCWFIFDVLFYGNTLFQPVVLSAVFGDSETISDVARDTSLLALIALPGYFVTVLVLGKQSPKWIQLQGFIVMSILYLIIGFYFSELSSKRYLLLTLYGLTFFFSDYGPNSTVSFNKF